MKIAITGAAGFLATNLERLADPTVNIKTFDFIENYQSPFLLLQSIWGGEKYDAVIHLGANSNTQVQSRRGNLFENTVYTNSLASLCAINEIPFIFASTFAVYGNEGDNASLSPYAVSKIESEKYIVYLGKEFPSWRYACLRFTNIYGRYESKKGPMKSIPVRFIEDARNTGSIKLWISSNSTNQGVASRDFIYADHLSQSLWAFIDSPIWRQEVLDFGSGVATSLHEVAKIVQREIDCEILEVKLPSHVNAKNYQLYTQANIQRLLEILPNYNPTTLDTAIPLLCKGGLN